MTETRKIIHIDMDAFYASVEQLDHPELRGKPVIVGGRPDSRGVVAACSYEARKFGIKSAMPCAHAYRLCPEAIFIRPRMARYQEMSARIMQIFRNYTDVIEPLSLDEAYLDVTLNKKNQASATVLAREICQAVYIKTGLTASAGVSCNKFVAKIASDLNKPNGVSVIEPAQVENFLGELPVGKFHGVGKVTEKKMLDLNIHTGADLRRCSQTQLTEYFGKHGSFYYHIVRGNDPRPVQTSRIRKSVGAERTLKEDTKDMDMIRDLLTSLFEKVCLVLNNKKLFCQTITIKVRYSDFTTITRSTTFPSPQHQKNDLLSCLPILIAKTEAGKRPIRLLGVSASNLSSESRQKPYQMTIPFHDAEN